MQFNFFRKACENLTRDELTDALVMNYLLLAKDAVAAIEKFVKLCS